MRRFLSLTLCVALLAASLPSGALAGNAQRGISGSPSDDQPRKRDTKGMIAWAGSFLLSGAVLGIAYSEMKNYRELGQEAESNGEDPARFYDSYDRMGWIATTAGLGAILSGVMFLKAAHGREDVAAPRRVLPPAIEWPPEPRVEQPPLAGATGSNEMPTISGAGLAAADPVADAIEKLQASAGASSDSGPVVTQTTKTRQAWLPGTKVEPKPVTVAGAATAAAAALPSAGTALDSLVLATAAKEKGASHTEPAAATPTQPVITQTTRTQQAWIPAAVPQDSARSAAKTAEATPAPATVAAQTSPDSAPRVAAPAPAPTQAATKPAVVPPPPASPATAGGAQAAPASSAAAEKPFSLHVGSHRSQSNATREAEKWRTLGYAMRVVPADLGEKGKWFRVFLGEFATAGEAKQFLASFQQEFPGQYAYVLHR